MVETSEVSANDTTVTTGYSKLLDESEKSVYMNTLKDVMNDQESFHFGDESQ